VNSSIPEISIAVRLPPATAGVAPKLRRRLAPDAEAEQAQVHHQHRSADDREAQQMDDSIAGKSQRESRIASPSGYFHTT
jgi:hypothetical protein